MEKVRLYKFETKFEMVREIEGVKITNPEDIFQEVLKDAFSPFQESFFVVLLDAKNQVLSFQELFKGGLSSSTVDISTLLRSILLANATSFVVAHNHPTGGLEPSPDDKTLTEKIKTASETVGLGFLDHLIFSGTSYFSFAENSLF